MKVLYEGEVFIVKALKKQAGEILVWYLEKLFAIDGSSK